jgi:exodeoxyribonuclease VII large subunit
MGGMVETAVRERKTAIRSLELRFQASSPMGRLQNIRQQMDDFMRRAETAIRSRLSLNRTRLQGLIRVLEGVAPTAVLGRGYALVWRADSGRLVRSVAIASAGTPLRIQLADGNLKARSEGKMDSSAGKRASELPDG